jgi:predicted NAD-dependent protein-ADP-ribosyltransferase YbiA (DUF1768 family)
MSKTLLNNFVITFFSAKKEYRSLSNFWEKDIVITVEADTGTDADKNERVYESGEHCFQGEKYIRLGELCDDKNRKAALVDYGKTFMKPSLYKTSSCAKKMGGKKGLLLSSDELEKWYSISIDVQHSICNWKSANYEEVRADLLKSGNKILIHPAMRCSDEKLEKTRPWEGRAKIENGKVIVLGKNLLGNIWAKYR